MIFRLLLLGALMATLLLAVLLWRRPPGRLARLARLDLADLGVPGPAIVQFSTKECAPCRIAAPRLREAAGRAGLSYAQVDLGERPDVASRYGIRTVPTIVVSGSGGEVLRTWTSLPGEDSLDEAARRAL